jgi:hypothetical protein
VFDILTVSVSCLNMTLISITAYVCFVDMSECITDITPLPALFIRHQSQVDTPTDCLGAIQLITLISAPVQKATLYWGAARCVLTLFAIGPLAVGHMFAEA